MSRQGIQKNQNSDSSYALYDDSKALFLQDLKKTQYYIQAFSQATQQLLKIAVKEDYSNSNMVRLLHQVMNLVYEITKWIYTLMQRDELPNEHCMKLLDKVAKQASQVVEAFKQAVVGEDKALNSIFLTKFMAMTELIHKVLDDFLIYGNPVFLNVIKNAEPNSSDSLQRKQSERRGSVGNPKTITYVQPIVPVFDKRRASVDSPIIPKSPARMKNPSSKPFPIELDEVLKRSSSDVASIEETINTKNLKSPLQQEVVRSDYYDLPSNSPPKSPKISHHDSSPRHSPRVPRKPSQLKISEETISQQNQFNRFLSEELPLNRGRKLLSNDLLNEPLTSDNKENSSDISYVSPAMLGNFKFI